LLLPTSTKVQLLTPDGGLRAGERVFRVLSLLSLLALLVQKAQMLTPEGGHPHAGERVSRELGGVTL
jgi:hypothetical protein